jgi:hypothetical protein
MAWFKVIFWLLVVVALVVLGPLATIWSLNMLFPTLAIPYSLETWAAIVILASFFKTNVGNSK